MLELSQNCGSDRYKACADEIARLKPDFCTFAPTPVDLEASARDFKSPYIKKFYFYVRNIYIIS